MADGTKIEWCDASWQITTGCSVISPGCTNCYAMRLAGTRMKHHASREGLTMETKAGPVWTGEVRFNEDWLDQPVRWKRARRIFVAAHGDLFHESIPDDWIDRVFAVMALAPQHTFQVLTKRAERMRKYCATGADRFELRLAAAALNPDRPHQIDRECSQLLQATARLDSWPLPNVWLGVSVEDQQRADERIPLLLDTPAAKRFISAEPLLFPIDLSRWLAIEKLQLSTGPHWTERTGAVSRLDWVIVGGESGPNARPMHPSWPRDLRDQCAAAGVAYFFKQWGAWQPHKVEPGGDLGGDVRAGRVRLPATMANVGKAKAGRLLDGREWNETP